MFWAKGQNHHLESVLVVVVQTKWLLQGGRGLVHWQNGKVREHRQLQNVNLCKDTVAKMLLAVLSIPYNAQCQPCLHFSVCLGQDPWKTKAELLPVCFLKISIRNRITVFKLHLFRKLMPCIIVYQLPDLGRVLLMKLF